MKKTTPIIAIACIVVVLAGAVVLVRQDIAAATQDTNRLRREIDDIADGVSRTGDRAKLDSYAIRMDDVFQDKGRLASRHRLASWFTNLDFDLDLLTSKAQNVSAQLTQKRR